METLDERELLNNMGRVAVALEQISVSLKVLAAAQSAVLLDHAHHTVERDWAMFVVTSHYDMGDQG